MDGTTSEAEFMLPTYFKVFLASLLLSHALGCASPLEFSKFRYVGAAPKSEDDFLIDRTRCTTQAPPVPIVEKYLYQNCMARRDWIITE